MVQNAPAVMDGLSLSFNTTQVVCPIGTFLGQAHDAWISSTDALVVSLLLSTNVRFSAAHRERSGRGNRLR